MKTRHERLLSGGTPRYIRCYDNGGATFDQFTVVFTGRYRRKTNGAFVYVGMSAKPYDPQGFGQHGDSPRPIDVNKDGFAPAVGRTNHLGKRITFGDLPPACRILVLSDYRELWSL
jgi:hypothetical protein